MRDTLKGKHSKTKSKKKKENSVQLSIYPGCKFKRLKEKKTKRERETYVNDT